MTTTAVPSLRTEKQPDRNFLSLNRNSAVWHAGTEAAWENPDPRPDLTNMSLCPAQPKDWETILKCSGRYGDHFAGLSVAQGKENSLDINAVSNDLNLEGDWGLTGVEGEQIWTVKGGSYDIRVTGRGHSRGTRADLVVGLWSDQSATPSHDLDFSDLSHVNGRPLTVILCRVNQPWLAWFGRAPKDIQLPPNAQVLKLRSLGAQIHWLSKWVGVKLGLIKGTK